MGVGGSLALETWGSGVGGFLALATWGSGVRGSLALATWPYGPHTETASQTANHACDPLTALSAPDVVRTCGDAMTSLQGHRARCLLWVSRRLFLMIQAMTSVQGHGARCPLWVSRRAVPYDTGDDFSPRTWSTLSAVGQPSAVPCDTGDDLSLRTWSTLSAVGQPSAVPYDTGAR